MGVGAIQNIVRFLHISSKIWFESLYRVAENDLTMKAGFFSVIDITRKLEFCLPDICGGENSSFFYVLIICSKSANNNYN
jgi:hypothetical protein